ncbi:hypothetical protein [Thermomonospora umbrina]|uniref:Uncharacterized protein n=1 Tax=Thermomonospora umbrina TaxID=111806 RepID=A0A3D9SXQ5_9ACTN|nr:hypothetical protein [Thermomonospora umbrina]REF00639.1 hypothetical protein DFJ69_6195 [Thermomonospora umbrina]
MSEPSREPVFAVGDSVARVGAIDPGYLADNAFHLPVRGLVTAVASRKPEISYSVWFCGGNERLVPERALMKARHFDAEWAADPSEAERLIIAASAHLRFLEREGVAPPPSAAKPLHERLGALAAWAAVPEVKLTDMLQPAVDAQADQVARTRRTAMFPHITRGGVVTDPEQAWRLLIGAYTAYRDTAPRDRADVKGRLATVSGSAVQALAAWYAIDDHVEAQWRLAPRMARESGMLDAAAVTILQERGGLVPDEKVVADVRRHSEALAEWTNLSQVSLRAVLTPWAEAAADARHAASTARLFPFQTPLGEVTGPEPAQRLLIQLNAMPVTRRAPQGYEHLTHTSLGLARRQLTATMADWYALGPQQLTRHLGNLINRHIDSAEPDGSAATSGSPNAKRDADLDTPQQGTAPGSRRDPVRRTGGPPRASRTTPPTRRRPPQ